VGVASPVSPTGYDLGGLVACLHSPSFYYLAASLHVSASHLYPIVGSDQGLYRGPSISFRYLIAFRFEVIAPDPVIAHGQAISPHPKSVHDPKYTLDRAHIHPDQTHTLDWVNAVFPDRNRSSLIAARSAPGYHPESVSVPATAVDPENAYHPIGIHFLFGLPSG
jgi:hypothetical protein